MTDEEKATEIHMLTQARLTLKNHLRPYHAYLRMEVDLADVEARLLALDSPQPEPIAPASEPPARKPLRRAK